LANNRFMDLISVFINMKNIDLLGGRLILIGYNYCRYWIALKSSRKQKMKMNR